MARHVRAELSTTNQEWQAPPPSQTVRGRLDSTLPSPSPSLPTAERGMFTEQTEPWAPDSGILLAQSLSRVRLFGTPWAVAHQVPLSMGFPRQEY